MDSLTLRNYLKLTMDPWYLPTLPTHRNGTARDPKTCFQIKCDVKIKIFWFKHEHTSCSSKGEYGINIFVYHKLYGLKSRLTLMRFSLQLYLRNCVLFPLKDVFFSCDC